MLWCLDREFLLEDPQVEVLSRTWPPLNQAVVESLRMAMTSNGWHDAR
jgi:hypothetical protein